MSEAKRLMEEQQSKREVAVDICLEVGVLKQCDCGLEEIYDPIVSDWTPAYKKANSLISKNDAQVAVFKGNRTELCDTIKELKNEFPTECSHVQRFESF